MCLYKKIKKTKTKQPKSNVSIKKSIEGGSAGWCEWVWFRAAEGLASAEALFLPWEPSPGQDGSEVVWPGDYGREMGVGIAPSLLLLFVNVRTLFCTLR